MNRGTVNVKQIIWASLFWGSLWGIAEATLGYLAHSILFVPGLAGFIMFPIGFYFMNRAYKNTGQPGVIMSSAAVAASIKLVDLLFPGLTPIHTINPAIAILMESVPVFLVYKVMKMDIARFRFREALVVCTGWRLGFLIYNSMLLVFAVSAEFMNMGLGHILRFIVLEPAINAAIITAYLMTEKNLSREKIWLFPVRPVMAGSALTAAILVESIFAVVK